MWDVAYIIGTLAFFALMMLYVEGCERLGRTTDADRSNGEQP